MSNEAGKAKVVPSERERERRARRKEQVRILRWERMRNSIFVVRMRALLAEQPDKWRERYVSFTELWRELGSRRELPENDTYWGAKGWFSTPAALATHIYALPTEVWKELNIWTTLRMLPGRSNPVNQIMFARED